MSLGDANELARMCKRWYDICRRQLLEECDWTFARKVFDLNLIGQATGVADFPDWAAAAAASDGTLVEGNDVFPWAYIYRYPANVLFVHKVYNDQAQSGLGEWSGYAGTQFRTWLEAQNSGWELVRSKVTNEYAIATNLQDAICKYTADIADTSQFSSSFAIALSLKLAQRICLPLTGDKELRMGIEQDLQNEMTKAMRLNHSENPEYGPSSSTYEDVRGM